MSDPGSDSTSGGNGAAFDAFRRWIEAQQAALAGGPGAAWARAETLHRAWVRFLDSLAEARAERHGGPDASPFDPAGWLRAEGAGGMADLFRWLEGPEFSDLWAEQRRAIRETRQWFAWCAALEQMKAVLGRGWLDAFRDFCGRLAAAPGGAEGPRWPEIVALWQAVATEATDRLYRSPAYLAATRDLVRAEAELRRALRERAEIVADLFGLPTRAELDDLHETVHRLRREVRALRAAAARPAPAGAGNGPR